MILVTGATGHFGGAALDFLLRKRNSEKTAALARDVQKAEGLRAKGIEVRRGDYFDYDSLVRAFAGVEKLLFVSSNDLTERVLQHANVIDAAKAANVERIVYTSVLNPPENPYFTASRDHLETEKLLRDSGIAYTVLRNAFYFETMPMFLGGVLETGEFAFPAGDARVSHASRLDMAEAAANVLLEAGHENKIYEIGANGSFSFQDIADALSELAGRPIAYVDVPLADFKAQLRENQTPAPIVEIIAGIAEAVRHGELNYPSADLENLLGRKLLTLKEFLRRTYFEKGAAA
ncbi:MAG TPA: SDR family oxidoreductase [Pyrinomonadaceae bacterium]|jgi:NAD(P)H dehydrogenase (quinone)